MEKKIYNTAKEKVIDFIIGGLLAAPFIVISILAFYLKVETDFMTYLASDNILIILGIILAAFISAVSLGIYLCKKRKFMGIGLLFFVVPVVIGALLIALVLGACGLMFGK
ncbi:MAG: hypothetical protein WC317_06335 [Candidatus Omnitrophota bacterium]|jgi:predicted outer membrane lipoprotein